MSVVQGQWLQPQVFWLLKYIQRYVRHTGHSTRSDLQRAKNDFESLTDEEKQPVLNRSWYLIKKKWDAICHNFQPPKYLILLRATNEEILKKYTKYFINPLNVRIEIEEIIDFLQHEPRDNLINSGILDKMGGYIQYNSNDIILEKAAKFISFLCGSKILNQSDSDTLLNYLQFLLSLNSHNLLSHALAGYKRIFDGYYHGKIEKENIESIGKVFIEQFMEEKDLKLAGIITATQKQDTLLSDGYIRNKEYELDLFGIDDQIPFVINGVVNQYYNNWYGQKPDQMKLNVVGRLCQLISFGNITNDFMYKLISVINILTKAVNFNAGDLSIMARIYLKHDIVTHLFEISKRGKYTNCCIKMIIAMNILLRMCDNDAIESNNIYGNVKEYI